MNTYKMQGLTLILGAGFSKPAGLPLANEINEYFTRDNKHKVLSFSSGEKKWFDYASDTDKHNGRINDGYLIWGYVLNELVSEYIKLKKYFDNYEDFYQYIIDLIPQKEKLESIFQNALLNAEANEGYYNVKNPNYESNAYNFKNTPRNEIKALINELVGDLLYVRNKRDEIIHNYVPFIQKIQNYETIDIITLNHDLLIETCINKELKRNYSDGFTREQKILFFDKKPLNTFVNLFIESISLIKLHGSIDTYKYEVFKEDGSLVIPTGDFLYYKTHNFYEKQRPERYDPDSGEVVQTFHKEISPQFITGTRKEEIIALDKMYADLYKQFDKRIHSNRELLIIGYSYADKHVNEKIESALQLEVIKRVVNVNPRIEFPFALNSKKVEVLNLKDIQEIK